MEWIKVVDSIIAKFDEMQTECNKGKIANGMVESSRNKIIDLADQIYDIADQCKTDNPSFDQFIKRRLTFIGINNGRDFVPLKTFAGGGTWYYSITHSVAFGRSDLLTNKYTRSIYTLIKVLQNPFQMEYIPDDISSFAEYRGYRYDLFNILVSQRISYLNKQNDLDIINAKFAKLEQELAEEKQKNEELRKQLIANGSLQVFPDYNYEEIKQRNKALHKELLRIQKIFIRGIRYEEVPMAILASK